MELSQFSTSIQTMQHTRNSIDEFYKLLEDLQKDIDEMNQIEKHIEECQITCKNLEAERKSHAEELRQINQDINVLEDIGKGLRGEVENSKLKVSRTLRDVKNSRNLLNNDLRELGLDVILEPCQEEIKYEPKLMSFPFPSLISSIFPPNSPCTSIERPNNLVNRHRMPPQFVELSKMKRCENCGGNIHRNAPTCPMCKTKTKSKNPKRKKNKNEHFQF